MLRQPQEQLRQSDSSKRKPKGEVHIIGSMENETPTLIKGLTGEEDDDQSASKDGQFKKKRNTSIDEGNRRGKRTVSANVQRRYYSKSIAKSSLQASNVAIESEELVNENSHLFTKQPTLKVTNEASVQKEPSSWEESLHMGSVSIEATQSANDNSHAPVSQASFQNRAPARLQDSENDLATENYKPYASEPDVPIDTNQETTVGLGHDNRPPPNTPKKETTMIQHEETRFAMVNSPFSVTHGTPVPLQERSLAEATSPLLLQAEKMASRWGPPRIRTSSHQHPNSRVPKDCGIKRNEHAGPADATIFQPNLGTCRFSS